MAELQYPTFEANQVLTEKHLNQLREYVQAEDHQTRVHGIGVGILGGLEVSVGRGADDRINQIEISCGAGITTAGYLVQIDRCELTHYRAFADADPHRYGLLWTDDDPPEIKGGIWELLREGDDADQSKSLSASSAVEDLGDLSDLVVVLYAECRQEQIDVCNLEDCDDKGADVYGTTGDPIEGATISVHDFPWGFFFNIRIDSTSPDSAGMYEIVTADLCAMSGPSCFVSLAVWAQTSDQLLVARAN